MSNPSFSSRNQFLQNEPTRYVQISNSRSKPNLFLSCVLAASFSASLMGMLVDRSLGMEQFATLFQAACFSFLLTITLFNKKHFRIAEISTLQLAGVASILVFTGTQALYWMFSRNIYGASVNKALGIFLTFFAAIMASRILKREEWILALKCFAIVELVSIVVIRLSNFNLGFNNNNIGMRITVAGLVLFALLDSRMLRYAALGVGLGLAFTMQCRTSVVAALGALAFLLLERYSRRSRVLYVILSISFLFLAFAFLPALHAIFVDSLVSMLGSDSALAQFLLSDKSAVDIKNNLFDRTQVWEHAWLNAKKSMLFGHGIGSERNVLGEVRSHNAYLSLIVEGGFVFLFCWLLFYIAFLVKLFDRSWVSRTGQEQLGRVAILIICYMLLSGLMESSGLGSISTPNNIIFMFLSVYLLADQKTR